ncbi:MAG: co-chaperone GroES [Deltaproteobacteria bacterium]|nr:co-chaperone GroES [Deltaproteobacteria bacterium]
MTITPLNDYVVLKSVEVSPKNEAGIYLPENMQEKPEQGIVTAVSDELKDRGIAVGDLVIVKKYAGNEFEVEGEKVRLISWSEILGKIVETDAIPD